MNDQNPIIIEPTDPFVDPTLNNADAIEALHREAEASVFDREKALQEVREETARNSWKDNRQHPTEEEMLKRKRIASASAEWTPLQKLVFRRAGAAIVVADGYGMGVSMNEMISLTSIKIRQDSPESILMTARAIFKRLMAKDVVAGAGLDAIIIEADETAARFLPEQSSK